MKQPTKEQIEEFWKWCEVMPEDYEYGFVSSIPLYPPIDLNNLFKYAVEKVMVYLEGHLTYDRKSAIKYLFKLWLKEYFKCWDFELALFWALYEVMK